MREKIAANSAQGFERSYRQSVPPRSWALAARPRTGLAARHLNASARTSARTVDLAMTAAAELADLAAERSVLGEAQMMGI